MQTQRTSQPTHTNGLLQGLKCNLLCKMRLSNKHKFFLTLFIILNSSGVCRCVMHTWSGKLLERMSTWREMVSTKLFLRGSRSSSVGQKTAIWIKDALHAFIFQIMQGYGVELSRAIFIELDLVKHNLAKCSCLMNVKFGKRRAKARRIIKQNEWRLQKHGQKLQKQVLKRKKWVF